MKTISIKDIEGIRIGNAQNFTGGTGCTVILSETGMCAGLDVRGGGPASRESELLKPLAAAQSIHAVLLGGGSAFGLDAAGGVMQFLEEKGIGFDAGVTKVPLVCQSDIFDLTVADAHTRPDKAMGYEACKGAYKNNYQDGNFGVGTGATVGKFRGMDYCMKSGIGSYAVQIGELKVGAIVAVNALGDIYDHHSGRIVAGMLNEERSAFADTAKLLYSSYEVHDNKFVGNTTIGAIITMQDLIKVSSARLPVWLTMVMHVLSVRFILLRMVTVFMHYLSETLPLTATWLVPLLLMLCQRQSSLL